ncbi:unnamed protein product [Polarella glacialis]|uniref:Uncharacterized protein n=1 Tax=Polarella glacialis TaxID=89957 RepID=A0A813KFK5_POLGL|nr:unnamed protein product [Polarella glacialis]
MTSISWGASDLAGAGTDDLMQSGLGSEDQEAPESPVIEKEGLLVGRGRAFALIGAPLQRSGEEHEEVEEDGFGNLLADNGEEAEEPEIENLAEPGDGDDQALEEAEGEAEEEQPEELELEVEEENEELR